jgi:transcription termination factor Rho
MSGMALERSVLERKERDELATIASALGLKAGARAKKETLIDQILKGSGVAATSPAASTGDAASSSAAAPSKPRARTVKSKAAPVVETESDDNTPASAAAPARAARAPRRSPASAAGSLFDPFASPDDSSTAGSSDDDFEVLSKRQGSGGDVVVRTPEALTDGPAGEDRPPRERFDRNRDRNRDRGERPDRGDRPERGPRPERGEAGGDRPDRGPRPDRGDRPDRGPRQDRGDRPGFQGQNKPQQGGWANNDKQDWDSAGGKRNRRRRGRDRVQQQVSPERDAAADRISESYEGELIDITGILDLADQGFGYIRAKGYLPTADDVYVPVNRVKQLGLRKGDFVTGAHRPATAQEKFPAIVRIDKVNGHSPEVAAMRPKFEDLTPLFPDVKLNLEQPGQPGNMVSRIVDLVSPIGKGQRGLIVSPPKAGKTTIMKQIASSIEVNNPEVHLMVLLVDERPEEVTDMRRTVSGEVIASTFDKPSDEHTMIAELCLERAKRLVEEGRDVVIILDGITRLARAYNLAAPATGRIMSGGIDTGALYPPKKFFGAARNVEEGGSLTILATALVETGSTMDTVIFEEFKGTGNMELRLDRRLAEKRIYPAINVNESSTRHEELLFDRKELEVIYRLRRVLNGLSEDGSAAKGLELLMDRMKATRNNMEFLADLAKAPTPGN